MATQNNEKASNKTNFINKDNSINYGNQSAIGTQNNIVININYYVKNIEIDPNCPYREYFLLPEDARNFFGRDEFVKKLLTAIETNNFISVLGESKSGKSSAILAGLVPKLAEVGNWLFTYFCPVKDPFSSIARALALLKIPKANKKELKTEVKKLKNSLKNNTNSLSEIINKIQQKNPDKRILIIADQFEQLYNASTKDQTRDQFINVLLQTFQSATKKSSLSTTLLAIIGTNSSGNIGFYRPLPDVLKKDSITLEQMTRDKLREVIEKPSRNFEVDVKKRLVERLIEDVIEQQERLALLSFALIELWKKQKDQELTYKAYQEITGNEDIVEVYKIEQKKRTEENNLTKKTTKNNTISEAPIIYRIVILLFLFFVGMPVVLEIFPIIFDSPVRIICKLKDKC